MGIFQSASVHFPLNVISNNTHRFRKIHVQFIHLITCVIWLPEENTVICIFYFWFFKYCLGMKLTLAEDIFDLGNRMLCTVYDDLNNKADLIIMSSRSQLVELYDCFSCSTIDHSSVITANFVVCIQGRLSNIILFVFMCIL